MEAGVCSDFPRKKSSPTRNDNAFENAKPVLVYAYTLPWRSLEDIEIRAVIRSRVADTTMRNYLGSMTAGLVGRQSVPWHENLL